MLKLITFLLLIQCAGVAVAETATVGDCTWTYKKDSGVWQITSVVTTNNEIVVPSVLGGKYIPVIASNAFYHCHWLKKAKISVGIKMIGESAFRECKYLEEIELPQGLESISHCAFMACCYLKSVVIPDGVTVIGTYGFHGCISMESIVIPDSVKDIGSGAFYMDCSLKEVRLPSGLEIVRSMLFQDCTSLTNVVLSPACWVIMDNAFLDCMELKKLTIPDTMEYFAAGAFDQCSALEGMDFEGWPPEFYGDPCLPKDLHIRYNVEYIRDWAILIDEYGFTNAEAYYPEKPQPPPVVEPTIATNCVAITVTNVIVQYVFNSVQPSIAVPQSSETGYVNVLTEIKGGAVAVPSSWADNYPRFREVFGNDFAVAMTKTIKNDGTGNPIFVWQDFEAGTDPTDANSKFEASITLVDGKPVISWTPELKPEQAGLRKYTVYGKAHLYDEKWSVVDGDTEKYGFFKVAVEMKNCQDER